MQIWYQSARFFSQHKRPFWGDLANRPKLLLLYLPGGPVPVQGLLCFPRLSSDAWWHQRVSCSRWNTGAPCSNVVTVAKGICAACFEGRPLVWMVEDHILNDNRFYSGSAYLVAELTLHRDLRAGAPWRQLSAMAEEMRRGRILFYLFQSNKILAFSWQGIIWSDPSFCILSSILKRHFPSLCSPPYQLWSTTAKCPCMGPLCRPLWGHRLPGLGRVLKPPRIYILASVAAVKRAWGLLAWRNMGNLSYVFQVFYANINVDYILNVYIFLTCCPMSLYTE